MPDVDVSVVIPALNEGRVILQGVAEMLWVLEQTRYRFEIIIVDDGSTDHTTRWIEALTKRDPRVRAIFHEHRMGRGQGVVDGIRAARGRYVGFIDVDMEVHARYVPSAIHALERGYDAATAYRVYKLSASPWIWLRMIATEGYRRLVWRWLRMPIRDTETGFKFFRRDRILPILEETQSRGWFWDTEVMAYCVYRSLRCIEIPALFMRRSDKKSSVRLMRDSLDYARSLRRFRRTFLPRTVVSPSPLYRWRWLYHFVMRCLYGFTGYRKRFRAIAAMIPPRARVLDVCCGDGLLWEHLRSKSVTYVGVDLNAAFLQGALQRGAGVVLGDVRTLPLESLEADYVVMIASLYQFIPHHREVLDRLARAARVAVVIVEPVTNMASSRHRWLASLAARLTNPGTGPMPRRFARAELETCLRDWGAQVVRPLGRRELIARRAITHREAGS